MRYLFRCLEWNKEWACAKSLQWCPTVCNPMYYTAHQAPLSMGFSRQEYWSGLPFLPPGDLPDPGIKLESPTSSALAGRFFTTSATWEAPIWVVSKMIYNRHLINSTYSFISFPGGSDSEESTCNVGVSEVAQSRLTLCDSMDCSLPGFSVRGIFQARVLEWVAISFSKRSSWLIVQTWVSLIAGRHFTI